MAEKKELISQIVNIEYAPDLDLKSYEIEDLAAFPLTDFASIVAVKPIMDIVGSITGKGGAGLYYVKTDGLKMFKSDGGYIGSLMNSNGGVAYKQARMTPLTVNPANIAYSCAVMAIEHKINEITGVQKNIYNFIEQKEKAKIKANINTLLDVINNYKYNMDNEIYKNNKHNLVQNIKKASEESILLTESLIKDMVNKKTSIHTGKNVELFMKEAVDKLNDYQLSLYQFVFSSFLEMILLENFDKKYIDSILKSIVEHKKKYELSYSSISDKLQDLSNTTVQNILINGTAEVLASVGKAIKKTQLTKMQLDQKLISKGDKLHETTVQKTEKNINKLSEHNVNLTEPFEKAIIMIKKIYSGDYSIAFDKDNLYLDFNENIMLKQLNEK